MPRSGSNEVKSLKHRDFTEIIFSATALFVLLLVWFQWDAVTVITVFLMPFYWLAVGVIIIGMVAAAIIQAVKRRNGKPRRPRQLFGLRVSVRKFRIGGLRFCQGGRLAGACEEERALVLGFVVVKRGITYVISQLQLA
jgi:magnesium-transporting ATPase (P-type)